jgi:hypothetical protein
VSIIHYMTCDFCTERWLTQAHLWLISSISGVLLTSDKAGQTSLWLRVEFSETGRCELKVVSFMKLNLDIKFIR